MINPSAKNTLAEKQTEASKQQAKTQGKKSRDSRDTSASHQIITHHP